MLLENQANLYVSLTQLLIRSIDLVTKIIYLIITDSERISGYFFIFFFLYHDRCTIIVTDRVSITICTGEHINIILYELRTFKHQIIIESRKVTLAFVTL